MEKCWHTTVRSKTESCHPDTLPAVYSFLFFSLFPPPPFLSPSPLHVFCSRFSIYLNRKGVIFPQKNPSLTLKHREKHVKYSLVFSGLLFKAGPFKRLYNLLQIENIQSNLWESARVKWKKNQLFHCELFMKIFTTLISKESVLIMGLSYNFGINMNKACYKGRGLNLIGIRSSHCFQLELFLTLWTWLT